ncbi:hypothetical protein [Jannaschia faecimaris]|uniref:hypothetical protein n=1 Tax=Jannaschia faecimaris TaxID=1244108 RepID=UPI0011135C20|nr:hypothetical protein [Jannaschia faecimaris]
MLLLLISWRSDPPEPAWFVLLPLLVLSGQRLLVGARFTEIVVNADGISVRPNGPHIPANQIRTIRTSGSHLRGRVSLSLTLNTARWILLYSPISVLGQRGEIVARLG